MYFLLVTGLSGAGKSSALHKLEDLGFFCVDNLPVTMLKNFLDLCKNTQPNISRVAVAIDSRSHIFDAAPDFIINNLNQLDVPYEILFLDCQDEILQNRYNESRRPHPLAFNEPVLLGIQREREHLQLLREHAHHIFNTSTLKPQQLAERVETIVSSQLCTRPTLLITSFGYKNGVPIDADIVFDMRFLKNPFYEPNLRALSGMDKPVRDYISADPLFNTFFSAAESMLTTLLPSYFAQGRNRISVAFGCTGGRHRSVAGAQEMARRFSGHDLTIRISHRDLDIEAANIKNRFSPQ